VEGRKVFIEIDGEEVKVSNAVFEDCLVISIGVEELRCGLGSDRTDLSITAGISRNK